MERFFETLQEVLWTRFKSPEEWWAEPWVVICNGAEEKFTFGHPAEIAQSDIRDHVFKVFQEARDREELTVFVLVQDDEGPKVISIPVGSLHDDEPGLDEPPVLPA